MKDLKPCPFCGGEARIQYRKTDGCKKTYGVLCLKCTAQFDAFFLLKEEVVKAWNHRVKL